jgi:hypothetical protein
VRSLTQPVERLDEQKIELLCRWGEGLEHDAREELRAAGRAILLLIEEIERLHVDLWNARSVAGAPATDEPEINSGLLARIGHFGRRGSGEAPT